MQHLKPTGKCGHVEIPVLVHGNVVEAVVGVDVVHLLEALLADVPEDIDAPDEGARYVDQTIVTLHEAVRILQTVCHFPAGFGPAHGHIALAEIGAEMVSLISTKRLVVAHALFPS